MVEFVGSLSKGDEIVSFDNSVEGVVQKIDASQEYKTAMTGIKVDGIWYYLPTTDMVLLKNRLK